MSTLGLLAAVGCGVSETDGPGAPVERERTLPGVTQSAPVDITAIAERAQLALHRNGEVLEGGAETHWMTVAESKLRFTPVAPSAKTAAPVELETTRFGASSRLRVPERGGTTVRKDGAAVTDLGGVREVLVNSAGGVEQSWEVDSAPVEAGDFTVRVRVTGQSFVESTVGGLHFRDPASGVGVRYGMATWVDAAGRRTPVTPAFEKGEIVLSVPEGIVQQSAFPAVLDPLISAEVAIDSPAVVPAGPWRLESRVARAGNVYLVAFESSVPPWHGLRATRIDATTLEPIDSVAFPLVLPVDLPNPQMQLNFDLASDGTDFVVVWGEERDALAPSLRGVYARRIRATGAPIDGPVQGGGTWVGATSDPAPLPSVLHAAGRYFVTWASSRSQTGDVTVEGRRLDPATLISLDEPGRGIRGLAGRGDLAMATDGDIVLVLVGGTFVRVRLTDGALLDSTPVTWSSADAPWPTVAFDGGSFTIVWEGISSTLRILRIAPSGAVLDDGDGGPEVGRRLCSYGLRPQLLASSPNPILLFAGELPVRTVYGTRIDATAGTSLDAAPGGACGLDMGLSPRPDRPSPFHAVASDGALFVTAHGQGRAFDSASLRPEQPTWTVPTWYGDASEVGAASNGNDFLVAWVTTRRSGPNASMQAVVATRLDGTGAVLDPEPVVLYEGGSPMKVSVASSGNDYIVAWIDEGFSSPDRICATRVRASEGTRVDGTATSCGIVLDQGDALWQVAVASTGNDYLLAWRPYAGGSVRGAVFPADPAVAPAGGVLDLGSHGFIADVALAPAQGGRYVLVKGGATGAVESVLIDPATRGVGSPVAISEPGASPEILRLVAGAPDLLALWGRHNSPSRPEQLRPSFARLSNVDGSLLAPGVSFLRTLHPLDRAYFFAAHDGRHLWTAWLQDVGLHQQDLVGTRLDSMGRFLDGPGPAGTFPILRAEWLWDAELAPDARGRLLVVDSSLDRSMLTRRIRARFIQTSPEELDAGIEYHPYPIPDGAPFPQAEAGADASSGSGGGQSQPDATAPDGAALSDSGTGGTGRDAAPGRDGAASAGDARADRDTGITPVSDAATPGDGSATDASSGGGAGGSGSGGTTTAGGGTGAGGRQVAGAGGRQVAGAGGTAPTDGGDSGVIDAPGHSGDSSGCGCAVPRDGSRDRAWLSLLCAAVFVARRRTAKVGARSGTLQ